MTCKRRLCYLNHLLILSLLFYRREFIYLMHFYFTFLDISSSYLWAHHLTFHCYGLTVSTVAFVVVVAAADVVVVVAAAAVVAAVVDLE